MKAWFVAHGYEVDSHNLKTDSPTYRHEAMPIVLGTYLGYEVAGKESGFQLSVSAGW